ncbi:MAG: hypothetical protein RIB67_04205 [Miltoncostaeaceae bacterium]
MARGKRMVVSVLTSIGAGAGLAAWRERRRRAGAPAPGPAAGPPPPAPVAQDAGDPGAAIDAARERLRRAAERRAEDGPSAG